jgi:hypothetical protein
MSGKKTARRNLSPGTGAAPPCIPARVCVTAATRRACYTAETPGVGVRNVASRTDCKCPYIGSSDAGWTVGFRAPTSPIQWAPRLICASLKLTTRLHLVPKSGTMQPYRHSPSCLHDADRREAKLPSETDRGYAGLAPEGSSESRNVRSPAFARQSAQGRG